MPEQDTQAPTPQDTGDTSTVEGYAVEILDAVLEG
jgi:hypothetical protein